MVSSPAVVDDTVYVGGGNFTERASEGKIERLETHTHLYALDANTGELRWKFETDTTIQSAPAYVDGTVYVACNSGTVYALDADSGTERWRFTTPNANGRDIMSTPAVSDCRVYVGSWEEETLYSLDARDGSVDWQYKADDPVSASPAVHEGTVFAGVNGGGPLVALSADNGAVSWEYETGGSITGSSPAVADGTVFVGDHSYSGNRLHAVEAETGDEMWSTSTRGPIWASPAVADDVVYVADLEHTVYGFDTAEGTERWRFETGGDVRSSPAITGGMLFVGSEDGYVYALTDSGEATSESLK